MVRALLDGRKTQTRRALDPQPLPWAEAVEIGPYDGYGAPGALVQRTLDNTRQMGAGTVRFFPGDRLWVKEPWTFINMTSEASRRHYLCVGYDADGADLPNRPTIEVDQAVIDKINARKRDIWQNRSQRGRFMFKALSRLTLLVTEVRIERLGDCSEADAIAEGIRPLPGDGPNRFTVNVEGWAISAPTAAETYRLLWNHINGTGAWEANPWVVAVTFSVEQRNIDA